MIFKFVTEGGTRLIKMSSTDSVWPKPANPTKLRLSDFCVLANLL